MTLTPLTTCLSLTRRRHWVPFTESGQETAVPTTVVPDSSSTVGTHSRSLHCATANGLVPGTSVRDSGRLRQWLSGGDDGPLGREHTGYLRSPPVVTTSHRRHRKGRVPSPPATGSGPTPLAGPLRTPPVTNLPSRPGVDPDTSPGGRSLHSTVYTTGRRTRGVSSSTVTTEVPASSGV